MPDPGLTHDEAATLLAAAAIVTRHAQHQPHLIATANRLTDLAQRGMKEKS